MEDIVILQQQIAKAEKELQTIEKRMHNEPQLDLQMQIHAQARKKHKEIDELKLKLNELK